MNVDVRVIAATNKNLEEEIEKGNFRDDLYFRLAVIPIYVPSLRERTEDIPLLVKHFLNQLARENNRRPKQMTPAALDVLKRYRWRGNIRELRNTIERVIIMSEGEVIDAADLPESVRSDKGAGTASSRADHALPAGAAGCGSRHVARVQGIGRAGVAGGEAARERVEHLKDRRSDRHASQQPLQEARAVRDPAGKRRLGFRIFSLMSYTR